LLIFQQGLATCRTSFLLWQLFKQLVVSCEEPNPVSEVDPHALMELQCDLFACGNASDTFDAERCEVSDEQ
jgi:hypothetical protein